MADSDQKTRARLAALEREARERPRRHALRLMALALVGYLYPVALLFLSLGLVAALLASAPWVWDSAGGAAVVLLGLAVIAAFALAGAVISTLFVELSDPDGYLLRRADAGPLRAMVEEVRKAVGGPIVHSIGIDASLNASVTQRPRFGFWGPRKNFLVIGMPLLIIMTPAECRAVLEHEFGHLRSRHVTFGSWIYRVQRTWELLAKPFQKAGWVRWILMGWFVRWYGAYFSTAALALRRQHEYAADRCAADSSGREIIAQVLVRLSWFEYRLGSAFWPELRGRVMADPLPPGDVLGLISTFVAAEVAPEVIRRWRDQQRRARTPVWSHHPCLLDRLTELGCGEMLTACDADDRPSPSVPACISLSESAVSLLGDDLPRLWSVANASWKTLAIERWRLEHGASKYLREKAAKATDPQGREPAEVEWEQIAARADFAPPSESEGLLREFLGRFPNHAPANFALGRLLLDLEEKDGVAYLERAAATGSDYIAPVLQVLLHHHRESGRDADADPILQRIEQHDAAMKVARKARLRVTRREALLPHGLRKEDLAKICRVLRRMPSVRVAYLAKREMKVFADKPGFVLAIERRTGLLDDTPRGDRRLVDALHEQVEQACAIVILGWRSRRLRKRVVAACPEPIYLSAE